MADGWFSGKSDERSWCILRGLVLVFLLGGLPNTLPISSPSSRLSKFRRIHKHAEIPLFYNLLYLDTTSGVSWEEFVVEAMKETMAGYHGMSCQNMRRRKLGAIIILHLTTQCLRERCGYFLLNVGPNLWRRGLETRLKVVRVRWTQVGGRLER